MLLHAITDALLGAIGDGDIGSHFPPSDPQWRGAPSALFLAHARDLVARARRGDRSCRCDDHLRGAQGRPASRRDPRAASPACCAFPMGRISIKATTTERLGFTGRGEGIAAQAMATVRLPEDS